MIDPRVATTFLFVPGDRPARFQRAASSGADVVVIDLEDGVEPASRPAARRHVQAWLRDGESAVVRINVLGSPDYMSDVQALRGVVRSVMLPKVESSTDVAAAATALGAGTSVVALVETPRGIAAAGSIAEHDAVVRLAFGNVDLAAELGVAPEDRQALLMARSLLALASASAGLLGPVDGVTTDLEDEAEVSRDAAHAASLGFRGKLCIHPHQVAPARSGMAPSPADVTWARDVLSGPAEGGARVVGAQMVDRPVEQRARDILRRASR
ncbi:HpcH/HpaI aldolase/citrate lyase family protein [Nocardioides sp. AN3]